MTTPTVAFSTHCYEGDKDKLYKNLDVIMDSHDYNFTQKIVVHQRTSIPFSHRMHMRSNIEIKDGSAYKYLFRKYGVPVDDQRADEITHGTTSPHYWKNHVVNHLAGLNAAETDYIVFSDSDCVMVKNEPCSWVEKGIEILEQCPDIFCVSPGDGAPGKTWVMSQQLFLVSKIAMENVEWDCWDGEYIDGGPFQEWYAMAEGRIGMYMKERGLCRLVLSDNWRYWHSPDEHKVPPEYEYAIKDWR